MPESIQQEILEKRPRLGLDARFTFRCGPDRECFNRCCSDVSILLSPYDVLRLKRALHLDSSEFLEKHALVMRSRERQVPVVLLRMNEETRDCPFVGESGCSVYPHRPWACRMYPLGMAEPKEPEAAAQRFYFLVTEAICQGHRGPDEHSVRDWIGEQEIEAFDQMQGPFLALLSHPGWDAPESRTQAKLDMYLMALYDLDRFRRFVFDTRFLALLEVEESRMQAIAEDDEELLEFAIDWLAFSLFHEKTMRLRKPVPPQAGAAIETRSHSPGDDYGQP
ncbi:MAG: YkgJ family cysteine cluster protein [Acidobacteriota bacterium]